MDVHAAAPPTPAITLLGPSAEKRAAEEAEEAVEAPKAEEPAPEVPEQPAVVRAPDPAYREQLVKAADPLKSVEDLGASLTFCLSGSRSCVKYTVPMRFLRTDCCLPLSFLALAA